MNQGFLSREQEITLEAKHLIRRGFLGCLPALLLPIGFLFTIATGFVPTQFMVILLSLSSFGSIMLGQGLIMLVTKQRIDLTLKKEMTAGEKVLTVSYALGWVVAVIGGATILIVTFLN